MKRFLKKISRMLSIIMIITLIPKVAYSEVNDFGENASEIQTNEESNFQEQIGEESNSQEQAEDSQEQIDEKNNSEVQANEGSNSQEQVEDSQEQIGEESNSQEQAEDSQERIDEKNNSEVQANEGSNSQEQVEDSQEQIGEKNNSDLAKYPNTIKVLGRKAEGIKNECRAIIGFNVEVNGQIKINVDISDVNAPAHDYVLHSGYANQKYFSIKVFKSNGELKFEEEFKGSNSGNYIATILNDREVQYGDIIQLYHREPNRLEFTGSIIGGAPNANEKTESIFKITSLGLEKCDTPIPKIEAKDDLYIFKDDVITNEKIWEGIECKDEIQQVIEERNKKTVITCNGEGVDNIDTSKIGDNQKVTYTVTNNFGKSASVERTIYIIDRTYPNTIEVHGIAVSGAISECRAVIGFNLDENGQIKINVDTSEEKAPLHAWRLHGSFVDKIYFSIKVFSSNGEVKFEKEYNGSQNGDEIAADLNTEEFKYGDIIKLYHREAEFRLKFTGSIIGGAPNANEKTESIFKITPLGLEKCDTPIPKIEAKDDLYIFKDDVITNEKIWEGIECKDEIQQVIEERNKKTVITCNGEGVDNIDTSKIGDNQKVTYTVTNNFGKSASVERTVYIIDEKYPNTIEIYGKNYEYSGNLKDKIKFNVRTKKLEVTPTLSNNADGSNFLHNNYEDNEYFSIKIFDANGQIKLNKTFQGVSTTQEVANALNDFQFDYGYIIKMHHENSRIEFTGNIIDEEGNFIEPSGVNNTSEVNTCFFEITPFGLRKDSVVEIPDYNLRAVLNKAIDNSRNDDQIITKSQLVGLTGDLSLENKNISDLTGIQNCINITKLILSRNPLTSIEPIKNLTKLTDLIISRSNITSIEPLRGLNNIKYLDISVNAVSDISPLKSLINLETLWGNENRISDVSPLKNLPKLKSLHLYKQRIILPKVKSVGSKATIGNILKDEDGQTLKIEDDNGYIYNEENNTVTFTEISNNCTKEYAFSKQISAGNTSERFYGTVVQEIEYTDIIGCIAIPKTVEMQKVTDSEYVEGTIDIALAEEVGYSSIDVTMEPSLELTYNKDKYNKDKVKVDIFNNDTIINSNGEVGRLTRDNKNINLKLKAKKADFKYMNKVEYSGTLEFTFSN